jgi:lysophospholipase L1-like esterase
LLGQSCHEAQADKLHAMTSCLLAALILQPNVAALSAPRTDAWWQERHKVHLERSKGPLDVAFLGDSITQGWEGAGKDVWAREFSGMKVGNFGIGGDQTRHVLWRLQNGELLPTQPKVAVIMIGTNNTAAREYTPENTAESVKNIVSTIRKGSPKTKILLLDVFPRALNKTEGPRVYVDKINSTLRSMKWDKNVQMLNIGRHFMNEAGVLDKELMPDVLHLSPAGYDIWGRAVREKIQEMLGKKKENLKGGKWVDLFDGKTLKGWSIVAGKATYRVEDGTIIGTTSVGGPDTFLRTDKEYTDFEMTFDARCHVKLNSGIQFRSRMDPGITGPQVEIMLTPGHSGHFWGAGMSTGWLSKEPSNPVPALNTNRVFRNEEWNSFRVVVKGAHFRTWINGLPVGDVVREDTVKTHPKGFIGLQVHGIPAGEGPYEAAWKNIKLRELK